MHVNVLGLCSPNLPFVFSVQILFPPTPAYATDVTFDVFDMFLKKCRRLITTLQFFPIISCTTAATTDNLPKSISYNWLVFSQAKLHFQGNVTYTPVPVTGNNISETLISVGWLLFKTTAPTPTSNTRSPVLSK